MLRRYVLEEKKEKEISAGADIAVPGMEEKREERSFGACVCCGAMFWKRKREKEISAGADIAVPGMEEKREKGSFGSCVCCGAMFWKRKRQKEDAKDGTK